MINDAYRVRVQDTLILRLDDRVRILESEKASLNSNCSSEVKALTEKIAVQKDQGDIEKSLKEYYKIESRKHKRQRNGMIGVLGAVAVYGVRSIFKPP